MVKVSPEQPTTRSAASFHSGGSKAAMHSEFFGCEKKPRGSRNFYHFTVQKILYNNHEHLILQTLEAGPNCTWQNDTFS